MDRPRIMVAVPIRIGRWMTFGKLRQDVLDKLDYAATYCTSCVSSSILQMAGPLLGSRSRHYCNTALSIPAFVKLYYRV